MLSEGVHEIRAHGPMPVGILLGWRYSGRRMKRATNIVCLVLAGMAHGQEWRHLGPAPLNAFGGASGRVSAVVCSPTDADLYFAGGADGGLWRSRDGGGTWAAMSNALPTTAIGCAVLDPGDERVLYVGTGEPNFANHSRSGVGIFKSTDLGETWTILGEGAFAGRCISHVVIDTGDSSVMYAAVTRAGGFPTRAAAKRHPRALDPVGVYKSVDGGRSWTLLTGGLPAEDATSLVMDPRDRSTLYAAIGTIFGSAANGVYRSVDAGATWTRVQAGLPTADSFGRIDLALAPSRADRVYAYASRPCDALGGGATTLGAWRSDDMGVSWVFLPVNSQQATYGWYFTHAAVHPTNADEAYFAGLGMSRTLNAGVSFAVVNPPHPDVHAMAWDAAGRMVVGTDGGVYRRTGTGAWESRNAGLGTIQIYAGLSTHPTDDVIMYVGLQDNGTVRRDSESLVWTQVAGGDGGWTQIDPRDPTRVFWESQGTGALGGAGAGAGLTGRNCFLPPYVIDPADSRRMLYATERVFRSVDGGRTWTALSADLTSGVPHAIRALAIAPSDSRMVYAATNDSRFLASEDGGATFALRLTDNHGWPRVTREIAVDPRDARTVYLAGATYGSPHVRRSRDAGATWEVLDGDLPDVPVNVIALDTRFGDTHIYVGTDAGVYASHDEGRTWRRYGRGLPNACVVDLHVEPARATGGRIVAGTQGRGVWLTASYCPADVDDGSGTGSSDGGVTVDDLLYYLSIYERGTVGADLDDGSGTGRRDRGVTIDDLLYYVRRYEDGC